MGHRIIEINGQSVVATPHEKIVHILSNAVGEVGARSGLERDRGVIRAPQVMLGLLGSFPERPLPPDAPQYPAPLSLTKCQTLRGELPGNTSVTEKQATSPLLFLSDLCHLALLLPRLPWFALLVPNVVGRRKCQIQDPQWPSRRLCLAQLGGSPDCTLSASLPVPRENRRWAGLEA